jgi:hypothetical protein
MNGLGDAVLPREEDEAFGVDEVLGKDSGAAAGAAAADSQKTALTVRAHTQTGQTESAPRIPSILHPAIGSRPPSQLWPSSAKELDRVRRGTPAGWSTLPGSRLSRRTVHHKCGSSAEAGARSHLHRQLGPFLRMPILHAKESIHRCRARQSTSAEPSLTDTLSRRLLPGGREPRWEDRPGSAQ